MNQTLTSPPALLHINQAGTNNCDTARRLFTYFTLPPNVISWTRHWLAHLFFGELRVVIALFLEELLNGGVLQVVHVSLLLGSVTHHVRSCKLGNSGGYRIWRGGGGVGQKLIQSSKASAADKQLTSQKKGLITYLGRWILGGRTPLTPPP